MFFFAHLVLGCFLYSPIDVFAFERQLGVLNFTCTNSTGSHLDKLTIIEAKGTDDVLYYLWDFGTKPTFLIVQAPKKTKIKLNCTRFLNNVSESIEFTSKPNFMFGVIVNEIYEFNDENDTATFNASDPTIRTYYGENFNWNISFSQNTQPIPLDAVQAVGQSPSCNGSLNIAVGAYTGDGASVDPPHILHTANGSQVDIALNNFQTTFNKSRFAVQMIILSSLRDLNYSSMVKHTTDDENTPAVFTLNTITFSRPKSYGNNDKGYMLWRPIVYTSETRVVSNSTGTKNYNLTNVNEKSRSFNHTLLKAIYGDSILELFAKSLVISFGSRTDKFYQKTLYSCWSFVFGTGEAPDPDTNSYFFLVCFCSFLIASIVLAVLIALRYVKLPSFNSNRSESREVLVDNDHLS